MRSVKTAPYGSWESPIRGDVLASGSSVPTDLTTEGGRVYWLQLQPEEGGRYALYTWSEGERPREVVPKGFNVRNRVHEYGGASYITSGPTVYFSNFTDQLVYRLDRGKKPVPISKAGHRYADFVVDAKRRRLIAVREDHSKEGKLAVNTISWLATDGSGSGVLVSGNDFYSAPRIDPSGTRIAWLTWNFPNMPWDGTELWTAKIGPDGRLAQRRKVAGGRTESVIMPRWSPDGVLHFVSDRSGYWNIYRWSGGKPERVLAIAAEMGEPQWGFRISTYDFVSRDRIVCMFARSGVWHLGVIDARERKMRQLDTPYTDFASIWAGGGSVFLLGGSPTQPLSVVRLDPRTGKTRLVYGSGAPKVDEGFISVPKHIRFPTKGGKDSYGLLYMPRNRDFRAPKGERPPLIVMSHGGPTSQTTNILSLRVQCWTSAGFAVLDVDYGGSTGYGREYRRRLNGKWGVVDVDDCCMGAEYLAGKGVVDPKRLAIRGGSAGGYTTLCALAFRKTFHAGASHFGLSDLLAFDQTTHKFESRYLDILIAPLPTGRKLLMERSALYSADNITVPMIFFQGLEDVIVPPNQAEVMVDSLRKRGVPVAYVPFKGEQHGFRRAESIKRAFDAELYFYSKVFGFSAPGKIEPVKIWNLPRGD
jgi:dipeptidyl aminopeptidase/acylaminoacyl peptidase